MPSGPRFQGLGQWLDWQQSLHPDAIDLGLDAGRPGARAHRAGAGRPARSSPSAARTARARAWRCWRRCCGPSGRRVGDLHLAAPRRLPRADPGRRRARVRGFARRGIRAHRRRARSRLAHVLRVQRACGAARVRDGRARRDRARGRHGRAPRRREPGGRGRRGDRLGRARSHGVAGSRRGERSAARRPASCGAAGRPSSARRRRRARCWRRRRQSAPTCACVDATSTASSGRTARWTYRDAHGALAGAAARPRSPGVAQVGNAATALAALRSLPRAPRARARGSGARACGARACRVGSSELPTAAASSGCWTWRTTPDSARTLAANLARYRGHGPHDRGLRHAGRQGRGGGRRNPRRERRTHGSPRQPRARAASPTLRSRLGPRPAASSWSTAGPWRTRCGRPRRPPVPGDRILVFGSFHTVGPALQHLQDGVADRRAGAALAIINFKWTKHSRRD